MLANNFRRIALAQGLLPGVEPRTPSGAEPPRRAETPTPRAPEPCEPRDDAA
jgi:hypothetical protein